MRKLFFIAGFLCASQLFAQDTGLYFKPLPAPCRLVDTRNGQGPFGGGETRAYNFLNNSCGLPTANPGNGLAYSLNVTVVPRGPLGYLTVWQDGTSQPSTSLLNSLDGRVKATAAIINAGSTTASIDVFASNPTDVVIDVNGYFLIENTPGTNAFYPLTPCRAADTRNATGSLGGPYLAAGQARSFPIASGTCPVPGNAAAYLLNVTAVPHSALGYLTLWPDDAGMPNVSTLNAPTGTVTANMAIVRPGADGGIDAIASNDSDLVIDVTGYFAPPNGSGLCLISQVPCRVFDSRQNNGAPLPGGQTTEITIEGAAGACSVPTDAYAVLVNSTVIPPGPLGYLTMYGETGAGETPPPSVSTLNAVDGAVTSNLAILSTSPGQRDDAFPSNSTHLVVDLYGYWELP